MPKKIILCFDGTNNDPTDAKEEETITGGFQDNGITNVLKLHLLLGGDLKSGSAFPNQVNLYFSGVGTYGGKYARAFNAAFAPNNQDVARIVKNAAKAVKEVHEPDDELVLFGFSRGAAIARRFATVIEEQLGRPVKIRFMGVFDTVASIGLPNLDNSSEPISDVVFENNTISAAVEEALHIVALDERRKAFRPTLMNAEEKVTEIWFSGAHSDIGGGYRYDGLSDNALQYMLDEIERRELGIMMRSPAQINYDDLTPSHIDYNLDYEDMIIEPSEFGLNHQQKRLPLISLITLATRKVHVIEDDRPGNRLPLIHHSVITRILRDSGYRPNALKKLKHAVLRQNGNTKVYFGLAQHVTYGIPILDRLRVDEEQEVRAFSHQKYNHSGIAVQEGECYVFEVEQDQKWHDGGIECGPEGWDRDDVSLGLEELLIAGMEWRRRHPKADWFELIGTISGEDKDTFRVLKHVNPDKPYIVAKSGELCFFANDLPRFYGNNFGSIRVKIRRLE